MGLPLLRQFSNTKAKYGVSYIMQTPFQDFCDCVLYLNERTVKTKWEAPRERKVEEYHLLASHLPTCWFLLTFSLTMKMGDTFLRYVSCISTDYTASHPRR
jgi:hypothetical protein